MKESYKMKSKFYTPLDEGNRILGFHNKTDLGADFDIISLVSGRD